jgi:transposase-like protein
MKRRRWKPEQKALIVLEGLKGRPIGELCAEHEISQGQYYQWRDQFLANAAKARPTTPRPARTRERAPEEPGRFVPDGIMRPDLFATLYRAMVNFGG